MNEVKKNLVDHQIEKMKTEILNVVDKKQENFLQDMVQTASTGRQLMLACMLLPK